ncbi:MAG: sigma factor-like helix-turn-helix DNA-binding protein [Bacilli bacterium]|nr:sigma factor-like helix-turn-helix DNA-binding protein [Bacilli bacterium]
MENKLYYIDLFDFYGSLLTEKQQEYFTEYYHHDLSLSELADNHEISRNAIHKQIKDAEHKLDFYEEKLSLYKKKKELYAIIEKIEDKKIREELEEL